MKNYYVEEEGQNMRFRVYRKAPSSEIQPTFIAGCKYKEHAEMVAKALNQLKK